MKKEISYALILPLLIIAVWIFNHYQPADTQDYGSDLSSAFENVYRSSVVVKSGSLQGSGNIFKTDSDSIRIVTAAHVIDDEKDVTVSFYNGKEADASIEALDSRLDFAILLISVDEFPPESDSAYTSISIRNDIPTAGESVFIIDASTLSASVGTIANPEIYSEDFGQNMIYCFIDSGAGMSGSGLFDSSGKYIGMVLGGSTDKEAVCLSARNISF